CPDSTTATARFYQGGGARARGPGAAKRAASFPVVEHAPENVMDDASEIAAFHHRCSDLMRELLEELALEPDRPRPFPAVEGAMGWARARIASVLGGAGRVRLLEFGGRRPYRFLDERNSASGRWEMWMDAGQARAVLDLCEEPVPSGHRTRP